jgi:hypothetical protein
MWWRSRFATLGNAGEKGFAELEAAVKMYADSSAEEDEAKIKLAQGLQDWSDQGRGLDKLFGLGLASKNLELGYKPRRLSTRWYGDPLSAWGFSGGLTEVARDLPNADERVNLDRVGAKIMEMAW